MEVPVTEEKNHQLQLHLLLLLLLKQVALLTLAPLEFTLRNFELSIQIKQLSNFISGSNSSLPNFLLLQQRQMLGTPNTIEQAKL